MNKYIDHNDSIECQSAEITARYLERVALIRIENIGRCLKYKTDRNSWATNLKELCPKVAKMNTNSKLDKGDKIEADSFLIYHNNLKPLKISIINYTGQHKAMQTVTSCFTYIQIAKSHIWLERNTKKIQQK